MYYLFNFFVLHFLFFICCYSFSCKLDEQNMAHAFLFFYDRLDHGAENMIKAGLYICRSTHTLSIHRTAFYRRSE